MCCTKRKGSTKKSRKEWKWEQKTAINGWSKVASCSWGQTWPHQNRIWWNCKKHQRSYWLGIAKGVPNKDFENHQWKSVSIASIFRIPLLIIILVKERWSESGLKRKQVPIIPGALYPCQVNLLEFEKGDLGFWALFLSKLVENICGVNARDVGNSIPIGQSFLLQSLWTTFTNSSEFSFTQQSVNYKIWKITGRRNLELQASRKFKWRWHMTDLRWSIDAFAFLKKRLVRTYGNVLFTFI